MHFYIGIVYVLLVLAIVVSPSAKAVNQAANEGCTSFTDLANPCGCTLSKELFNPVCGTDGKTYLNECFLECRRTIDGSSIGIEYVGICRLETRCTCHARYVPVCGSNGITYSNECVLDCEIQKNPSVRLEYKGECENYKARLRTKLNTCYCNPANGPLCASNGETYPNYCVMRCQAEAMGDKSVDFVYWGMCEQTTTVFNKQLCDKKVTDDSEYEEYSDFEHTIVNLNPHRKTKGLLLSQSESSGRPTCDCPLESIKYIARCGKRREDLKCVCKKERQRPLAMQPSICSQQHEQQEQTRASIDNKLRGDISKTCLCAALHKPVCGTNRVTYANLCVLHCHAKKDSGIQMGQWGVCGGGDGEPIQLFSTNKGRSHRDDTLRLRKIQKKRSRMNNIRNRDRNYYSFTYENRN